MKLGLNNIRALLRYCHNPHKQFSSIHVAGTNGKGSTSSMVAAVLQAAGYKTGLYTSPHLIKFNERIRINGTMISDDDLVRYTQLFRPKIDFMKATFFEATTAIAFKYFADKKVDIAVVETGLGGRLDATNVLHPEVSVITSIAKDHTAQLGRSIRKIAFEKGGIIKYRTACIVGVEGKEALEELRSIARSKQAPFITIDSMSSSAVPADNLDRQIVNIRTKFHSYEGLDLPLLGNHQVRNAVLAITTLEQLQAKGIDIPSSAFRNGFSRLREVTGINGRFEVLQKDPLVILDVGHNPNGISATIETLRNYPRKKLVLLFGVMKDKDYRTMIRLLSTLRPFVFAVQPALERALSAETIVRLFRKLKCSARSCGSVSEAMRDALRAQKRDDVLLICGSHYVAGEALESFRKQVRPKKS
jgi:dihydrofolate synthase/folylpolyglutamate synthase